MKLTETIERCEKLVLDEIECYDWDIEWHQKNIGDTEENKKRIQEWNGERDELLEVLNNLRFIKYETGLEELDGMLEKENETHLSGIMTKILNYFKSLFKKKTGYYVKIDNSGASTAMNMVDYLISPEGQEQLKKNKEFFEKYKGVPLND